MATENQVNETIHPDRPSLAELTRKVLLAGIGAAALVQEEAEAFINRLIEKGELAEKDGRDLMQDLREKRRKKIAEKLDNRINSIISEMDIPTKADIDLLTEKISELSNKIESL
jgi:polyhydroxyalkanoate synthesis regulator phasin